MKMQETGPTVYRPYPRRLEYLTNIPTIYFADVAVEREVEGDLFLHDVGQGLCFKPGTFDGCIR